MCGVCSFSSRGSLRDLRGMQGLQEDNKVFTKDSIGTILRHTHMRFVCHMMWVVVPEFSIYTGPPISLHH